MSRYLQRFSRHFVLYPKIDEMTVMHNDVRFNMYYIISSELNVFGSFKRKVLINTYLKQKFA